MRLARRIPVLAAYALAALALLAASAAHAPARAAAAPADALADAFKDPPPSARPHTWWHWVNGNVTKEGITADLEAMARVGVGGAQIFNVDVGIPKGKAPFMTPQWQELIAHAVKEANRLGIELCVHNGAGWSSSGGPWITPAHAMQFLTWSERPARGSTHFHERLAQPPTKLGFYRDIAVYAFRRPPVVSEATLMSDIRRRADFERGDRIEPDTTPTPPGAAIPRVGVVDVTSHMAADGTLTWDVPAGDWTILRMGYTPTGETNHPAPPEGLGLECDKLSREALDTHWSGMMAAVLRDAGPLAGRTLNNALIDSYEVGSQNWTPKFREEFRKRRGYDPLPWLPVVTGRVVGTLEQSERFLWDLRRTVADLYADNYYGYFAELCHKNGLKASVEPYGNGPFDNIQCGGVVDIPMGEFWVGGGTLETLKLAASAGHTHGKPIIGAESFTADVPHGRWMYDPYSLKALGDLAFCLGVNRYIYHRYAAQPWLNLEPGMTMGPWGTHFERTQTWWNPGAAWLKYVARCQTLLQRGQFVADALYSTGEDGPNDLPFRAALKPALPPGYDYDGCDAGTVLRDMSARDGRIALRDGMTYRVLILPESHFMTPAMARKLRDLVAAGATVVGPKPTTSPSLSGYPRCDDEVRSIGQEVWGDCDGKTVQEHAYGKGRVVWGKPLGDVLAQLGAPADFTYTGASPTTKLAYIHRRIGDADVYFVSNQRYVPVDVECSFRGVGRAPELWRPDTGATEAAPAWSERDGRTVVPMRLDPAGSVFVVFRHSAHAPNIASVKLAGEPAPEQGPKLVIQSARYEAADGRGADVTDKVQAMVAAGENAIPASNDVYGDPVPDVVKRLVVRYTLDGKPMEKTVGENETLDLAGGGTSGDEGAPPPFELSTDAAGALTLVPWQAGTYDVTDAAGAAHQVSVTDAPASVDLSPSWLIHFPPGGGAQEEFGLEGLLSWTQMQAPGVKYFSGTAEYDKPFDVPADMVAAGRKVVLDLGRVKNLAEVTVNGRDLGVLWKAPFRVDVTGVVHTGRNTLSVKVTNLWPNRLIGDEQLPPDVEYRADGSIARWPDWLLEGRPRPQPGRVTFSTWRFFSKDSPLLESGLIGPVTLRSAMPINVR